MTKHADRDRSEPVWPPHARNAYQQPAEPDERVRRYGEAIWNASRADEGSISYIGANHVARAVIAVADEEQAALRRGGKTLGEILDRSLRDVLDASGMHHVIDETGDGDWELVWERLAELRPRLEAAERALAAERATVADLRHVLAHVDLAHAIATSTEDNA